MSRLIIVRAAAAVVATGSTETVGAGAAGGGAVATLLLGERPGGLGGPAAGQARLTAALAGRRGRGGQDPEAL
ncbi:MAG TPA: hypothetical protein VFQ68_45590 [Streptosporangiaceae bacterium]|nr:hypothetical protein [Streptosporangiaceae bacterium]